MWLPLLTLSRMPSASIEGAERIIGPMEDTTSEIKFTALGGEELQAAVNSLNVGWSVLPGKGLVRVVETADFKEGFGLLAEIAKLAEQQQHDPDLTLRRGEVEISLNTHEAGGITDLDVKLAKAIDQLL